MVTARVDLEGLWESFALLVVTTKPLLSAAALTWISMLLKTSFICRCLAEGCFLGEKIQTTNILNSVKNICTDPDSLGVDEAIVPENYHWSRLLDIGIF